jgi:hypothetical protein
MAMTRPAVPDLVTLVSLHAALSGIVEIEALFAELTVPTCDRLGALAAEMRVLLLALLRTKPGC